MSANQRARRNVTGHRVNVRAMAKTRVWGSIMVKHGARAMNAGRHNAWQLKSTAEDDGGVAVSCELQRRYGESVGPNAPGDPGAGP